MTRIPLLAAIVVIMPALVLSQTQRKQVALSQTEQELITLSRAAVAAGVGDEIVVADRFTNTATVQGKFDAVELVDAKPRIDGDLAVVTGRVVFKGGLPSWQAKEHSSSVTIRFSRQSGRWEFTGLCLGKCVAE